MMLLPFNPLWMSPAQLAAVFYPARYSGRTHAAYSFQPRRWFTWRENNGLDPLLGIQRAPCRAPPPPARFRVDHHEA